MGRCLKLLTEDVEELKNELASLRSGDRFIFGDYHGPIEWRVLSTVYNSLLVISEYALDAKPFDKDSETNVWNSCSLKRWLNSEFFNQAFNPEEKSLISNTPYYGKVFLLSIEEARKYFSSPSDRKCRPTQYAKNQGVFIDQGYCDWLLCSRGHDSTRVAYVGWTGDIGSYYYSLDDATCAVRPAMKLKI